jgi:glycogen synthase
MRIFYAAGPGRVIDAHKNWERGTHHPDEVALTYSGQFADYCLEEGAKAYVISSNSDGGLYRTGNFVLEHRPKLMPSATGIRYHLSETLYGLSLFATAFRFRSSIAVLSLSTTHPFIMSLFRVSGMRVVPVLHNTLWPAGKALPQGRIQKVITKLNAAFFRFFTTATICISPVCKRQVESLGGQNIHVMLPQFRRQYFDDIPPPPEHSTRPFRIAFAGRIERAKGVFDILVAARLIETERPGAVQWEVCGDGPELDRFRAQCIRSALANVVLINGWTPPAKFRDVLTRSHACIVPTRSDFVEGIAKTAVEAILAGRPVITNAGVPALELLRPACIEAQADNPESYAAAVIALVDDAARYLSLRTATKTLTAPFYDKRNGFSAALKSAVSPPRDGAPVFGNDPIEGRVGWPGAEPQA